VFRPAVLQPLDHRQTRNSGQMTLQRNPMVVVTMRRPLTTPHASRRLSRCPKSWLRPADRTSHGRGRRTRSGRPRAQSRELIGVKIAPRLRVGDRLASRMGFLAGRRPLAHLRFSGDGGRDICHREQAKQVTWPNKRLSLYSLWRQSSAPPSTRAYEPVSRVHRVIDVRVRRSRARYVRC
jgi:hypothetical protein